MARTTKGTLIRPVGSSLRLYQMAANATRTSWVRDPVTGLHLPGTLLEPARTNLCVQSETPASWPTIYQTSITGTSSTTLPSGAPSGNHCIHEDGNSGTHYIRQTISLTSGVDYCWSVYLAEINRQWIQLRSDIGEVFKCNFNLNTGTVGVLAGNNAKIEPFSDFYRVWYTWTADATAGELFYILVCDGDNDVGVDGLDQDSYFFYGSQVEAGSFPTSYIPTTTAPVQRTADSAVEFDAEYSPEMTVLFLVIAPDHTPSADAGLVQLRDAAASNYLSINFAQTTGYLQAKLHESGGGTDVLNVPRNICDGKPHLCAISVRNGGHMVGWVDGDVEASMQTTEPFPWSAMNKLFLSPSGQVQGDVYTWPAFMDHMPQPPVRMAA